MVVVVVMVTSCIVQERGAFAGFWVVRDRTSEINTETGKGLQPCLTFVDISLGSVYFH